jgi:hypothetical protein
VAADKKFVPDFATPANFLQARTGIDPRGEFVYLDFEMADFDPPLTTMGIKLSLDSLRELVHTSLAALDFFGDQPASVLLEVLNQKQTARRMPLRRSGKKT